MKIETKYGINDEFFFLNKETGKIDSARVHHIEVQHFLEPGGNYSHVEQQIIRYYSHDRRIHVPESQFYPTREALIATL